MKTTDNLWINANHLASFVMLLEHDQDYCIEKYNSDPRNWGKWIDELIDNNFKLDIGFPFREASDEYQEFLDFFDGNGFIVTHAPTIRIERNLKNENNDNA